MKLLKILKHCFKENQSVNENNVSENNSRRAIELHVKLFAF